MFVAQDHRFVYANAALPAMLGYTDHEFVGQPFAAVVAPEFLDFWTTRFDRRVGQGPEPDPHCEVQFLHRDGRQKLWIELGASRLQHRGRPAVLGLVRDVSERRRTQALLEAELLRRRVLIEESRDGIVVLDRLGAVYEANASFATMIGRGIEEVRSLHAWDWDQTWSRERTLQALGRDGPGSSSFETVLRSKTGI
jgi:PAS domain S-box-containing protein